MQTVGSDGADTSQPAIGTGRLHAGLAAGQFTAELPDSPEDESSLKGGAVSRYETSPPTASTKRETLRILAY